MKCIRVSVPKEPLVYQDKEPIPKAPKGGAVVKISYSGVCHSDVHFWEGGYALADGTELSFLDRPGFVYPCTPGHEIAGVIFSMDENLAESDNESGLKLGDRVIVYPWIYCNSCGPCKSGFNIYCDGTPPTYIGLTQDGGFAEYVAVPNVRYLVPLPASIPPALACQLPCSGLTAFHSVEEGIEFVDTVTKIKGRCSVLMIGAGGVGQWGVRLARALYPPETQIICAEVKQGPLDAVVENVKDVIPLLMTRDQSTEAIVQQVKSLSSTGSGVDLVLDFVGATQTYQVGRKSLRVRGHYHVTGLFGGEARFPLPDLVLTGVFMKGIAIGTLEQLKRLLELLVNKPALCSNLQYVEHPLEDGIKVMEKLTKGEVVGRAVLRCSGGD